MGVALLVTIIAGSVYGLIMTIINGGLVELGYFTILANMLVLATSVMELRHKIFHLEQPICFSFLTFSGVIAIGVTALMFLFVIAPADGYGFIHALSDNNWSSLFMHIIVPIASTGYYLLFSERLMDRKDIIPCSTIIPLAYLFLVFTAGRMGVRWGSNSMPYDFLNYEAECGWLGISSSFGYTPGSIGVGVAYVLIFLIAFFIFVGFIVFKIKKSYPHKMLGA